MNLSEVKAIVTGGASGMGRTFALELAKAGARVTIADVDDSKMADVSAASADARGKVYTAYCNVTNEDSVAKVVAEARAEMGGLNVLINNAGIFRDHLLVKVDKETGAVKKMSLEAWNSVVNVDLTGPFLCTREFAASVIQAGTKAAVVVNISSIARHGNVGQSNYSAAKAGLIADTRVWGNELARHGIRVGAVAPGFVDTPILQGMRPEVLEGMLKGVPLRRAATPEEIYMAVKFIVECDYFTGRCIDVDGGLSL